MSISRSKKIAIREEFRRSMLQNHLLASLAETKTYQNIITAELRPAWRKIKDRYWSDAAMHGLWHVETLLEDQRDQAELGIDPIDADLDRYCLLLNQVVRDRLRLQLNGEPSWWAREAIHNHVVSLFYPADVPVGVVGASWQFWREAELRLNVSDGYADVTAVNHAGQVVEHREVSADPLTSFRDWERLRTMAIEVLDNQLAELRALAEADYKRTGSLRQTRSLKSDLEMIPKIRDALLATPRNAETFPSAIEARIRRVCRCIRLDSLADIQKTARQKPDRN